jgi:hypothetical protein
MGEEILSDRRKALEDQFFQKQDAALLRRLREASAGEAARKQLSEASGIRDPAAIDAIVAAGIEAETLAALGVVPLIAVAWADGKLESNERSAVLQAAASAGLAKGTPAHALLEGWLAVRPSPSLLEAWRGYVSALPEAVRRALRTDVLGRAREIAAAAGGFLGLGRKVSADEARVLAELERSLG